MIRQARGNKYGVNRVEYAGRFYDSPAEAKHAKALDELVESGDIACWYHQVLFHLGIPENTFRPDFLVIGHGSIWVDEIKGFETEGFRRQKRLWKPYGPCNLRVIRGKRVETIKPANPWSREEILAGLRPKGTRLECVREVARP